jgi:hypothetical protein
MLLKGDEAHAFAPVHGLKDEVAALAGLPGLGFVPLPDVGLSSGASLVL